ncbi:MAG: hypothetical protein JXO49_04400 [Deltaproteobacteria bacterium]|nr:hypothetical protein [Candidatus Anaeroferrophillus wilburensis]MBN2888570.1 hypothetical protein [Deltaproteobacteria bacterium]
MNYTEVAKNISEAMLRGEVAPWKTEEKALEAGIGAPDTFIVGTLARRFFLEAKSGVAFHHLVMPAKPYSIEYRCPRDNSHWMLAAGDDFTRCGMCDTPLAPLVDGKTSYQPLVNNYIGGDEDYFSYAGEVAVGGDVNKTFQNILCYGPGVGHLGISVGCFQLNKYGPVEIKVADWAGAARNLAFVFGTEKERERARKLIKDNLDGIITLMTGDFLQPFAGQVYNVDFLDKQHHGDRILHCCFYTRFTEYRGHGCTSKAVGGAKNYIDNLFKEHQIACRLSVIGMGRDGDLKPSPRNRRGRYVSAQQRIPIKEYEQNIGRPIDDFLSYIELDRQGVLEETGWPAYSGMGGEIIPAFYRTMKNNPRPYLVSSLQKVYVETRGDEMIFGVELPNLEVGFPSGPEGIVPPLSREVAKVAGIECSKDFAAACAAITLGGEFNFATLHIKEKLYTGR